MEMLFYDHSPLGALFIICALIGGSLFLIRFMMQLLGIVGDLDLFDAADSAGLGDSDVSFKLLSVQGVAAFFTMFGLVGLAMEQAAVGEAIALLAAVAAGALSVWVIQKIFSGMGKLQSKGNIDLNNAIGSEGTVYLTVSSQECGKVELTVQNRLRVVDAMTESDTPLATGRRVRVVRVMESGLLLVESASKPAAQEES